MTGLPAWPYLREALAAMPAPFGNTHVQAFQVELQAAYGVEHAIAVSSGTAALHSALIGCGARPGTEVLLPAFTVVMTVAAVLATGARPIFVDCPPGRFGLDLDDADAKRTRRTVAIVAVHFGGRTGNLGAIRAFADHAGLPMIEDACQAQGSTWYGRPAGTIGEAGCFSLKDGKILFCGEGGYVLARDARLAALAAAFRTHWHSGTAEDPPGTRLGHNLRLAEPLAALARHSLADRDAAVRRRRAQSDLLTALVGQAPGLEAIPAEDGEVPNGYAALWTIRCRDPRGLCGRLAAAGVLNSVATFGLRAAHTHPACRILDPAVCPNAEGRVDTLLSVPLTSADSDERVARIAELIKAEVAGWH